MATSFVLYESPRYTIQNKDGNRIRVCGTYSAAMLARRREMLSLASFFLYMGGVSGRIQEGEGKGSDAG